MLGRVPALRRRSGRMARAASRASRRGSSRSGGGRSARRGRRRPSSAPCAAHGSPKQWVGGLRVRGCEGAWLKVRTDHLRPRAARPRLTHGRVGTCDEERFDDLVTPPPRGVAQHREDVRLHELCGLGRGGEVRGWWRCLQAVQLHVSQFANSERRHVSLVDGQEKLVQLRGAEWLALASIVANLVVRLAPLTTAQRLTSHPRVAVGREPWRGLFRDRYLALLREENMAVSENTPGTTGTCMESYRTSTHLNPVLKGR